MKRAFLCALILGCIAAVALTAEVTDEEQSDIDVLVTASRVEESVEDVPAYVSVITSDELSASGQTTLVDALEGLAGIHFRSSSGNPAQAEIAMRGFGENSFGRVLVLLDGRRLNRPDMASINWLEIPVENIERVEVVRGGSSVLYGDNAVAGVINIITKKGSKGFAFDVKGMYGSFNKNQEGAEVGGSIGALRLSANAEHTATDGYRDRSAYSSEGAGTSLGLDLERFSGSLSLSYSRLSYGIPGSLTEAQFESDPTQAQPFYNVAQANNQYLNADLAFTLTPTDRWLMDGGLSYGFKFVRTDFDYDDGFFPWSSFSDLMIHTLAFTPRISLASELLAGNRLIAGIDEYVDILGIQTFPDIGRTSTDLEARLNRSTTGLYASDDLSLSDLLTATAGIRYEFVWLAARTLKTSGTAFDESEFLHNLVYDVGLLLTPTAGSRLWAKYSTLFRYPFTDELVDFYGYLEVPFNTSLRPERGYQMDVGAETRLFGILKLAANGYWLDMTDEITSVETAPYVYLNINQDKTRHLGVETEVALSIPRWLELSANYSFAWATFRAGPNEGNRVPLVPAHKAGAEATVHTPLDVSLGGSAQYVSKQYFGGDIENALDPLAGYFLLGASVRYQPSNIQGDLDIYFGVDNLLDARYATTGYYGSYYPGEGRSWKVGASYRY
jgi:iron complex outermembrane receptor protein